MNPANANALTNLFNRASQSAFLRTNTVRIVFMGEDGADITIRPETPEQAARYLSMIGDAQQPLFRRATLFPGQHDIPSPILFTMEGRYNDYRVRKEYTVLHGFNLRFMERDQPGQLIYDEMFARFANVQHGEGPSLNRFIAILRQAGTDWSAVDFATPKPKRNRRTNLRLVHDANKP